MKMATKNGIDHIITATNEDNERQIEMMVGKAMCAYANWHRSTDKNHFFFKSGVSELEKEKARTAHQSEYEATVRCIAMFVEQPLSYVCEYIIARCFEEFGI